MLIRASACIVPHVATDEANIALDAVKDGRLVSKLLGLQQLDEVVGCLGECLRGQLDHQPMRGVIGIIVAILRRGGCIVVAFEHGFQDDVHVRELAAQREHGIIPLLEGLQVQMMVLPLQMATALSCSVIHPPTVASGSSRTTSASKRSRWHLLRHPRSLHRPRVGSNCGNTWDGRRTTQNAGCDGRTGALPRGVHHEFEAAHGQICDTIAVVAVVALLLELSFVFDLTISGCRCC
mmetsp:Transcript_18432/g.51198  ORF Transcript_18432/g.51198 Transcript_18432/m.51198 type:complete len:236 (+) Transcript_18432:409-1116(+)